MGSCSAVRTLQNIRLTLREREREREKLEKEVRKKKKEIEERERHRRGWMLWFRATRQKPRDCF